MDPFTLAAAVGTALVSAMATDAWRSVRSSTGGLFRRGQVSGAQDVDTALERTREQVVVARRDDDRELEERLVGEWRMMFASLLASRPELADEVRLLLEERIGPALSDGEQARIGTIEIDVKVSGHAKANVLGSGTQHNH